MIGVQLDSTASISAEERKELYSEDVQIVSKDGKLFYLPPVDKVRAQNVAEEFYHGFGSVEAEDILKEHLTDDLYEILMK